MKTQIHKLNKKNSLLHGVMVFIMLVPLIVGAIFSAQDSNPIKAAATDAPSKVNLIVTKYLFGDADYDAYATINNGGQLHAEDDKKLKKQANVPFRLYQMNIGSNGNTDNAIWAALSHFFGDIREANRYIGGHYVGNKDANGTTLPHEAEAAANENPAGSVTAADWKTMIGGYSFARALWQAYAEAFDEKTANDLIPDQVNGNGAKYPETEAQFNAVVENILQLATTAGTFTVKAGLTQETPEGQLRFDNIDNEKSENRYARYVLVESTTLSGKAGNTGTDGGRYDAESHKNERHTAPPMVLNLPIEDSWTENSNAEDGQARNDMYIYPKNELPLQAAQFRKVDMAQPAATEEEVNGWQNTGDPNAAGNVDPVSGASMEAGQNYPLKDAEFALFEWTWKGDPAREDEMWEAYKSNASIITKDDQKDDEEVSFTFSHPLSANVHTKFLPKYPGEGEDEDKLYTEDGFYKSRKDGIVLSEQLPYGKYFFMEVHPPVGYSMNSYPVTFAITPDNVDGPHPEHAVSIASDLDATIAEHTGGASANWQVPNYQVPDLTKQLEVLNGAPGTGNYLVPDGQGFQNQADSKYRYTLDADLKNPQTLLGDFIVFYDIFTTKDPIRVNDEGEEDEDGDYDYPIIGDGDTRELLNIKNIFDISDTTDNPDTADDKVQDFTDTPEADGGYSGSSFWDGTTTDEQNDPDRSNPATWNVKSGASDIYTTRIKNGVPSVLAVKLHDGKTYFFVDQYTDNNPAKYGLPADAIYVGPFTIADGLNEHAGIAKVGWYDAIGSNVDENGMPIVDTNTWAENGTPTGTQLYWSINTIKLIHRLVEKIGGQGYNEAENFKDEQLKLLKTIKAIQVSFELTPKVEPATIEGPEGNQVANPKAGQSLLNVKQLQALHNIGQFEWNSTDEHPWVETENNAYVGGQTFRKIDKAGDPLQTNGGHFVISRTVTDPEAEDTNSVTQYLQYDKNKHTVIGWVDETEAGKIPADATRFDTSEVKDVDGSKQGGTFTVFGLVPNSENALDSEGQPNPNAEISTKYSDGKEIDYRIRETASTLIIGEDEYRPVSQSEFENGIPFYIQPVDPTVTDKAVSDEDENESNDESDSEITATEDSVETMPILELETTPVLTTHVMNLKNGDLPITGGIGMLVFIVLGSIISYIGYRYFKKRRVETN